MSVQAAVDRTLSEQQALVRSYNVVVRSLKQWSVIYQRIGVVVEEFGDKLRATTSAYIQDISILESSQRSVVEALKQAELSRIVDPNGARVCPLDALSRGVLGSETGHLVNTLRMQEPNLRHIMEKLSDFRSAVSKALDDERAQWKSGVRDTLRCNDGKNIAIISAPVSVSSRTDSSRYLDEASSRKIRGAKPSQKTSLHSSELNARPPWSS